MQHRFFLNEVRQHADLPAIRSYLKLYSSVDVAKLADFCQVRLSSDTIRPPWPPPAIHRPPRAFGKHTHPAVPHAVEPLPQDLLIEDIELFPNLYMKSYCLRFMSS